MADEQRAPTIADAAVGSDFFAMRRKLQEEASLGGDEAEGVKWGSEAAAAKEALLEDTNLNFDDEEVCGAMEDPGLVSHMAAARVRLQESLKELQNSGSVETARLSLTQACGEAAEALAELKAVGDKFETPVDEISILGRRFESVILTNTPMYPHYPETPSKATCADPILRKMATVLKEKLNERAKALDGHKAVLKGQYARWAKARSLFLQSRDTLVRLCETQAEVIREQKEIIAALQKQASA